MGALGSRGGVYIFYTVQHYQMNTRVMLVDSIDEVPGLPELNAYDLSSINTAPCISFIKN